MLYNYLGKREGYKVAHTELSDQLKKSSQAVHTSSVGSALQGLTEITALVEAQNDVLV